MVRNYKRKNTRSGIVDEEAMTSAIKEVLNKNLSTRKSANKYGIKPSTLETRINKIRKAKSGEPTTSNRLFNSKYTANQVFTKEEEDMLNEYIIISSKRHYGLTLEQIRKLSYQFAKLNNFRYPPSWDENKMAGKDWLACYRKRNANLSLRKPENTSAARSFGFNKSAVGEFFENLEQVLQKHKFTGDRIYNFDESGISTVLNTPRVLAEKTQKQVGQLVSAERGELVTFGGFICANGNTIPPLFVFPRVHYKDHFIDGAPEGSLGVATKSGWINSVIFLDVLKHMQRHTVCSKENPILLLCDNHESHVTIDAINYARENGIIYLSFPPHTTHRLQPLDVGVFGPFKSKLKTAFNDWHVSHPGKSLNIYSIPKLAKLAYFQSFNGKNITAAFEKTGIWPFNKLVFSDEDFAPVQVYHNDSAPEPSVTNAEATNDEAAPQEAPQTSPPASPVLPVVCSSSSYAMASPSTSLGIVTPEMIRPYPKIHKTTSATAKKRKIGKSRIYTDTPEKNRLEDIARAKETKKIEKERKNRVKEVKRALKLVSTEVDKSKKQKKDLESESETNTDMSLRESSASPVEDICEELETETPVLIHNIKKGSFVVVKFDKKKSVLHYVGEIVEKYSPSEYKISFLRKKQGKAGSWNFVYPNTKDEGSVLISDIILILPKSKTAATARTARIFNFGKDFSPYNIQ
ncbi:uncharacterized protein [Onthophagus taurus]|uniref:uncharacterized protein n=1 Tax=Onthophagus taurus TaxID=166361 RepID=UPI000C202C39|nr:uncharacterized protein LOC111420348 [Onthophagus taurus]